jgi:hypothetical protein
MLILGTSVSANINVTKYQFLENTLFLNAKQNLDIIKLYRI